MKPLISVIMPVYNAEKFVFEAIKSIVDQTYTNWELIIINDGSSDSSINIIKEFDDKRIRIYENELNKGIAFSRNRAIDLANGKYIAIMDNDDISLPNRFEDQVNYLENHNEIDVLSGACEVIDSNGELLKRNTSVLKNPKYIRAKLLFQNVFFNGTVMLRKNLIDENNIRYRENQYGMEDFCFWVECSKKMEMTSIDSCIYKYREHENNETKNIKTKAFKEREKAYSYIQKLSLEKSGFKLEESDYKIIFSLLKEERVCLENKEDIEPLFKVLSKIVEQASKMELNNLEEIDIVCKQKIGVAIRNCKNFFI